MSRSRTMAHRFSRFGDRERGDAGIPVLLIVPALLTVVLTLTAATQQLQARREAFAVANAAARAAAQGSENQNRDADDEGPETVVIDEGSAEARARELAQRNSDLSDSMDFQVVSAVIDGNSVTVELHVTYDPVFPDFVTGNTFYVDATVALDSGIDEAEQND